MKTVEYIRAMYAAKKAFWMGVGSGITMMVGTTMLRQDLYGLEAYIEVVRIGWVQMSPWWGGGITALGISTWWFFDYVIKKDIGE